MLRGPSNTTGGGIVWVDGLPRLEAQTGKGFWPRGWIKDPSAIARRTRYLRELADRIDAGEVGLSGYSVATGFLSYVDEDDPAYCTVRTGKRAILLCVEDAAEAGLARQHAASAGRVLAETLPYSRSWADKGGPDDENEEGVE